MTVEFETLVFEIGGVRTVIKAIGKGKPVLFLHGASTLEGFDFAEGLADRFRVLCSSHPGFGFSDPAPHIAGMSDMVLHYLQLLDVLALPEKPHLVGFSMGGWMASELAGVAPERFDKVVLVAPAGLNDSAHKATDLSTIHPSDLPAYLAHDVSVALAFFPDGSNPEFESAFTADRVREEETLGRLLVPFGMGNPNLRRYLNRIRNPALVVWGKKDRLLPASQAPLFVDALPDAKLVLVEEAGHFVMQEKPETVTKIGDFLAG